MCNSTVSTNICLKIPPLCSHIANVSFCYCFYLIWFWHLIAEDCKHRSFYCSYYLLCLPKKVFVAIKCKATCESMLSFIKNAHIGRIMNITILHHYHSSFVLGELWQELKQLFFVGRTNDSHAPIKWLSLTHMEEKQTDYCKNPTRKTLEWSPWWMDKQCNSQMGNKG